MIFIDLGKPALRKVDGKPKPAHSIPGPGERLERRVNANRTTSLAAYLPVFGGLPEAPLGNLGNFVEQFLYLSIKERGRSG
jgi:hypothetical protein